MNEKKEQNKMHLLISFLPPACVFGVPTYEYENIRCESKKKECSLVLLEVVSVSIYTSSWTKKESYIY